MKHSKKLGILVNTFGHQFELSNSKIIRLFRNHEEYDHTNIEIYSFELILMHSFNFNCYYHQMITYQTSLSFVDVYGEKCTMYDVELKKANYINFNLNQYSTSRSLLFHFDGVYYYISNYTQGYVHIIDHKTLEIHKSIEINDDDMFNFKIYNKNLVYFDRVAKYVTVYDSNDNFLAKQRLYLNNFSLVFLNFGNVLFEEQTYSNLIEYEIY